MITFLANLVIPLFIFILVLYGTLKRKDIYTPFLEGVMDGFKIVLEIAPTLIALFFAIQIFRSSGALDLIVRFLTQAGECCGAFLENFSDGIFCQRRVSGGRSSEDHENVSDP